MNVDSDAIIVVVGSIITVIVSNWYHWSRAKRQNLLDSERAHDIKVRQKEAFQESIMIWVDRLEGMLERYVEDNEKLREHNGELLNQNIVLASERDRFMLERDDCLEKLQDA